MTCGLKGSFTIQTKCKTFRNIVISTSANCKDCMVVDHRTNNPINAMVER